MPENLLFPLTMAEQFASAIDLEEGQDGRLSEFVYSDWLDELGDPRGEAWRMLMGQQRKPRPVRSKKGLRVSWRWYKYKYVFVPKESQIGKDYFLELPGVPKMTAPSKVVVLRSVVESGAAPHWLLQMRSIMSRPGDFPG